MIKNFFNRVGSKKLGASGVGTGVLLTPGLTDMQYIMIGVVLTAYLLGQGLADALSRKYAPK